MLYAEPNLVTLQSKMRELLMIGGAATEANEFNESELFSMRRITIAPMLIVAGYIVILYAIMKKNKVKKD